MDSRRRPLFDLNELPVEDDQASEDCFSSQPQKARPALHSLISDLSPKPITQQVATDSNAFLHTPSASGFRPFVRRTNVNVSEKCIEQKRTADLSRGFPSSAMSNNSKGLKVALESVTDREEGEWSDEDCAVASRCNSMQEQSVLSQEKTPEEQRVDEVTLDHLGCGVVVESTSQNVKMSDGTEDENCGCASLVSDMDLNVKKITSKGEVTMDGQEELGGVSRQRDVKGVEASHALRCANNLGKGHKFGQHKEAMLGKKRSRQTMFLNLEDVKQAGAINSTPRRQTLPSVLTTRTVKENRTTTLPTEHVGERPCQPINRVQKQMDSSCIEGGSIVESTEPKAECNGDITSGLSGRPRMHNSATDLLAETQSLPIPRQGSWKQPTDVKQIKNLQTPYRKLAQSSIDPKVGNKKYLTKKLTASNIQYQDTSVERLIREVTSEKFWHHPEETELQCIPGRFESVEEYVRVFEPLLFEECRAQLYSTWEELTETVSRDMHVMVRIKNIERRERGWYDVIVLPASDCKWTFKEGDVAILSAPRPGSVRPKRTSTIPSEDDKGPEVSGRVAGTVRRHTPIDTRDPPGAILHFYVGDSYDSSSNVDDDHILRKLHPKDFWYLTVLGSLATTQREYIALHAFRRLSLQMQTAVLQPSPEQFPRYEEQPPAMPECFTPNFLDHLRRAFNGPQLAAIQWAAMHTAAGTNSAMTRRQDPWPFTLVQGPPGTGKTHTVWGMLNVIHLVQYQHYYTALLKKLAPESYKQSNEAGCENVAVGSIDEVLQNMDQNLFRTLPKLCPKPRMLVCAPSNAATDELLARVLDRGFIDGEMKVYRPDVARVGVDSQTRAAQAVSVERRTEQLLLKTREEVYGWMHQLRTREAQLAQQIAGLQRELNAVALAGRSQGSVGVDPDVLVARDQNRDALLQNLAAVIEGRDKILVEMSRLLILEGRFRSANSFNLEEAKANLEASFANEAEIVFTTLSSSGRKLFSRLTHGFDMVVIDEAAQASEVAILPPLSLGAARCVLVGDPQQLPATVISKAAGTLLYSRSLFERFQQAGCPAMLLSVQYRMHPHIREFPSRYFYQGRLTDSESIAGLPDEVYYKDPLLRPYLFYDITHGRESHRGGSVSYQNVHEAQFCVHLYEHLQRSLKSLGLGKVSVGVITPYKLQLKCLQREFESVFNSEGNGKDLYINTVDAFQGQERDVIIMSCVRASGHGVGFVADIRRMNVALTRARRALWVMGNANALMQSEDWAALITDARARNCFMDMDSLPKDFMVSKGPNYGAVWGKGSAVRSLRSAGPRYKSSDMHIESRSGMPPEGDEKAFIFRNGNHRAM